VGDCGSLGGTTGRRTRRVRSAGMSRRPGLRVHLTRRPASASRRRPAPCAARWCPSRVGKNAALQRQVCPSTRRFEWDQGRGPLVDETRAERNGMHPGCRKRQGTLAGPTATPAGVRAGGSPEMILIKGVDLPEPFSPTQQRAPGPGDVEGRRRPGGGRLPPKRLAQASGRLRRGWGFFFVTKAHRGP